MGYPDQKDDQDTRMPVEDSERMADEDQAVTGRVIEPDEDRLDAADAGESVRPAAEGDAEGLHRYTGEELDALGAEDDQVVLESSEAGPVETAPAGQTVASAAADGGPDRVGPAIPMPGRPAADPDGPAGPADVTHPDPVPGPDTSAADGTVVSPSVADAPVVDSPVVDGPVVDGTAPAQGTAAPPQDHDWREIMAMFVDDPRAATERAASVVESSVEDLVRSLKGQQDSLRSSWQGGTADTEALRTALKDYRSLWQRLDGIARQH
jgi:hypothetical protein